VPLAQAGNRKSKSKGKDRLQVSQTAARSFVCGREALRIGSHPVGRPPGKRKTPWITAATCSQPVDVEEWTPQNISPTNPSRSLEFLRHAGAAEDVSTAHMDSQDEQAEKKREQPVKEPCDRDGHPYGLSLDYALQLQEMWPGSWLPVGHLSDDSEHQVQRGFVMPAWNHAKRQLDQTAFNRPCIRRTQCSSGQFVLVAWCTCCEEQRQREEVFNGANFLENSRQDVKSMVKKCLCLKALEVCIVSHSLLRWRGDLICLDRFMKA
jgi:hypothetical protein